MERERQQIAATQPASNDDSIVGKDDEEEDSESDENSGNDDVKIAVGDENTGVVGSDDVDETSSVALVPGDRDLTNMVSQGTQVDLSSSYYNTIQLLCLSLNLI